MENRAFVSQQWRLVLGARADIERVEYTVIFETELKPVLYFCLAEYYKCA